MRHDLHVAGHAFTARPVELDDAAFIVALRREGGPYINRGADTAAAQQAWLERYFAAPDDYYFVIERNRDHDPQGTAALYDVEAEQAEWGRFVLTAGSPAAVETALLVYRCAFEILRLARVYCRTLAANASVVAFHDSCGLARAPEPVEILHDGAPALAVEHMLSRERWPSVFQRLDTLAARIATRLGGRAT